MVDLRAVFNEKKTRFPNLVIICCVFVHFSSLNVHNNYNMTVSNDDPGKVLLMLLVCAVVLVFPMFYTRVMNARQTTVT